MKTIKVVLLTLLLGACSSGTGPSATVLNTTPRTEGGGSWENGVSASEVAWRLISIDGQGTRGAHTINWTNPTARTVTVYFNLRFYDSSGFQIDRWPGIFGSQITIQAGQSRLVTGNFVLKKTTIIGAANGIAKMRISASFS